MEIAFPGGFAVNAIYNGYTIQTDQPTQNGGNGSAPAPFELFLASIGTCAGFYALRFCQERNIDTSGLKLSLNTERDEELKRVTKVRIEARLPQDFPEKYRKPIVRAMDQCAVKRHILDAPQFEVETI